MKIRSPFQHAATALALAVLATLAACERHDAPSTDTESPAPPEEEVTRVKEEGRAAALALMTALGGQLKAALQSGGPVEAIEVCQKVAMPLTESSAAERAGVTVSRRTLQPRNPANAADERDREVLRKWMEADSPAPVVLWEKDEAHYYQPLMIQEVCLNCHGEPETFPAELKETLARLYPEDQATGYALGDLRGAIRVDVARN